MKNNSPHVISTLTSSEAIGMQLHDFVYRPVYNMKNNTSQVISTATSSEVIALQLTLCVVLLLTAVIGNGAVCFLVVHFKAFKTVPNILLANLACVEFFNNLVNVPLYMVYDVGNKKSVITSTVAWWMTFLTILFILLSLASMFILVADRYFAIAYTMKYYVWKSPRKALVAAMTAWISALVAAVLGSAGLLYNVDLGEKSPLYYQTAYATKTNYRYYTSLVFATLITWITIVTLLTLREIWKSKPKSRNSSLALRKNNGKVEQTTRRSASTILLTFTAYTVCNISVFFCFIIATRIRTSNQLLSQWLFFLANCLSFSRSSFNVFIYIYRSSKFRLALKKSLNSFCKGRRVAPFNTHSQRKQEGRAFVVYREEVW